MSDALRALLETSALGSDQAAYLESLYEQFLSDPGSLEPRWRDYFTTLRNGAAREVAHGPIREALALRAKKSRGTTAAAASSTDERMIAKQGAVSRLVQIYVNRGHLIADIDPLGLLKRPEPDVLKLSYFGLDESDLDTEFHVYSPFGHNADAKLMKLRDIIARYRQVYCGKIGAEFAHVSDTEERLWLQDRFQAGRLNQKITTDERKGLLWSLTTADGLERYLATKYPAQKRFSLEGGDSLIPLVDDLIQQSGIGGTEEIVIGMAHRGRLNVLVNVLGKSPSNYFLNLKASTM